jgi:glutaredoxin|tara:strand:- start:10 stop:387 length:378 start_codon:yes stop_codon:yes gene_type:complete
MGATKWIVVFAIIAIGLFSIKFMSPTGQSTLETENNDFASCLKENGAKFYGAEWCGHCNTQKELLGNYKPVYIECSLPDRSGQTPLCKSAGIQSYPTWKFADGTTQTGVMSLQELSQKTGCPLPA